MCPYAYLNVCVLMLSYTCPYAHMFVPLETKLWRTKDKEKGNSFDMHVSLFFNACVLMLLSVCP